MLKRLTEARLTLDRANVPATHYVQSQHPWSEGDTAKVKGKEGGGRDTAKSDGNISKTRPT